MLAQLLQCHRLVEGHTAARRGGVEYELVLRLRPDLLLPPEPLDLARAVRVVQQVGGTFLRARMIGCLGVGVPRVGVLMEVPLLVGELVFRMHLLVLIVVEVCIGEVAAPKSISSSSLPRWCATLA